MQTNLSFFTRSLPTSLSRILCLLLCLGLNYTWSQAAPVIHNTLTVSATGVTNMGSHIPNEDGETGQWQATITGMPTQTNGNPMVLPAEALAAGTAGPRCEWIVTSGTANVITTGVSSPFANFKAQRATPGIYQIQFYVKGYWYSGSGDDYYEGTSPTYTLTLKVVNIQKMQYRIGGAGNFVDVNGDIKVALDKSVELKALPNPTGVTPWPNNKPAWSTPSGGVTGATDSGESKTISFTTSGSKTINVECGNTVPVTIVAYTATVTIKRTGSTDSPSAAATVAAGHLGGSEHHAELVLQTTPAVAGVEFGELVITSGGQGAAGTINADASWNKVPGQSAKTDGAGKITGSFTSGNRAELTTLTQNYGAGSTSIVMANQVWNELKDSISAWVFNSYYYVGIPSPITYKMTFDDGVPITNHSVRHVTESITGWEWNPNKAVDSDGNGTTDYYGAYDEDITYLSSHVKLLPGGIYAILVRYSTVSEGTGTNAGKYSTNQTVNNLINAQGDVDFYTDAVKLGIRDSSSLRKTP